MQSKQYFTKIKNYPHEKSTEPILSLSRLKGTIETNPLVLRIDGLKSADANIYFEKNVNPEKCVTPTLDAIKVKQEYRFRFNR